MDWLDDEKIINSLADIIFQAEFFPHIRPDHVAEDTANFKMHSVITAKTVMGYVDQAGYDVVKKHRPVM